MVHHIGFAAEPAVVPGEAPGEVRAELADVGRYARRLVRRFVSAAREDDSPSFATLVEEHLGRSPDALDVVEESWPAYDQVNVQAGLEAWLGDGRTHELVGMVDFRHHDFGLGDLLQPGVHHGPRPGNVSRVSRPTGPDGETLTCVQAGVYLISKDDLRLALLLRGPEPHSDQEGVTVQIVATDRAAGERAGHEIRSASLVHNVHRGHVLSFGGEVFGGRGSILRFHHRPTMLADELILPAEVFADLERQVVGVARHRDRLRAARQHLKRGLLLYGPPGVGKTHTVRYLTAALPETTVLELGGQTLGMVSQACSVARALQPAMIVLEDVDLIAEDRDHYQGSGGLLFNLLNEMDGLDEDADVVFLLTTNRADLLEPALASRPGRVDQAVEIGLPDRAARGRLFDLYRGDLDVDTTRIDDVLARTDGVTASFLKELLRRGAVLAAAEDDGHESNARLAVSADQLDRALADLLDTRNAMTRAVIGGPRSGSTGIPEL